MLDAQSKDTYDDGHGLQPVQPHLNDSEERLLHSILRRRRLRRCEQFESMQRQPVFDPSSAVCSPGATDAVVRDLNMVARVRVSAEAFPQ